jgi:murein L,D-transpeptidase YcbB/YkuD
MAFSAAVLTEIETVANAEGIEPAALKAVVEVESNGQAFAMVHGKLMPLIRWEGHYFHQRLKGAALAKAVSAGLASTKAGGIPNPKTQEKRYDLLDRARAINTDAASQSVSWGVGQVMGANAISLGYASTQALVDDAVSGVAGQVRVMIRFIRHNKILDELKNHDWAGFARVYNGKGFKKFKYDTKMAAAYKRHSTGAPTPMPAAESSSSVLKVGSKGPAVKSLQVKLRRLGFSLVDDGDFGPATRAQLTRFQADNGLAADGIAGAMTLARIDSLLGVEPLNPTSILPK